MLAVVGQQLANIFAGGLESFSHFVKRQIDKWDTTSEAVDTTGDGEADTKVTGRSVGLSGKSRDITGDGVADFKNDAGAVGVRRSNEEEDERETHAARRGRPAGRGERCTSLG